MVLDRILRDFTREEFMENIKKDDNKDFVYRGVTYDCPNKLGFKEGCYNNSCEKCWSLATKDVKFKGENKMNKREELENLLKEKKEEYRKLNESILGLIDEIKMLPVYNFVELEDDNCFSIDMLGECIKCYASEKILRNYNTFTNEEYANKVAYKQRFERGLLAYKDETEDKCNWEEGDLCKYTAHISESNENAKIKIDKSFTYKDSCIYFNSKELLEKHIEANKDEWIEYFKICKELD